MHMKIKTMLQSAVKLLGFLAVFSIGTTVQAESVAVKDIPFTSIDGVQVGNAQENQGKTGVTVLCFPNGAKTGVDISGGGPASRETPVLDPTKENIGIHAIVLAGGTASATIQDLPLCHWWCSRTFMTFPMAVQLSVPIAGWAMRLVKMLWFGASP